jgi:hypothetical protein
MDSRSQLSSRPSLKENARSLRVTSTTALWLSNQADLYTKTNNEIAEYTGQTCIYSANIYITIKELQ